MQRKEFRSEAELLAFGREKQQQLNEKRWPSEIWFWEHWDRLRLRRSSDLWNEPIILDGSLYLGDCLNQEFRYLIEIDGSSHDNKKAFSKDQKKDWAFKNAGFTVFRIKHLDYMRLLEVALAIALIRGEPEPALADYERWALKEYIDRRNRGLVIEPRTMLTRRRKEASAGRAAVESLRERNQEKKKQRELVRKFWKKQIKKSKNKNRSIVLNLKSRRDKFRARKYCRVCGGRVGPGTNLICRKCNPAIASKA